MVSTAPSRYATAQTMPSSIGFLANEVVGEGRWRLAYRGVIPIRVSKMPFAHLVDIGMRTNEHTGDKSGGLRCKVKYAEFTRQGGQDDKGFHMITQYCKFQHTRCVWYPRALRCAGRSVKFKLRSPLASLPKAW